jgi:hypothetical protein
LCACVADKADEPVYHDVGEALVDLSDKSNYYVAINDEHFTTESVLGDLLEAGFALRYSYKTGELVISGDDDDVLFSNEQVQLSARSDALLPLDYNDSLSLDVSIRNNSDSAANIEDCTISGVYISEHTYTADTGVSFTFLGDIEVGSHKSDIEVIFGECPEISSYSTFSSTYEFWDYRQDDGGNGGFSFSVDRKNGIVYHIEWTNDG